ncbi:hypothetical protein BDV25DRAFT_137337 [Aspergillus avenaceus]|uniref:Uncharacterized protein n=1 Tax=Aspergillus avenaceus TaxID=36643 RepID=A0A5N6U2T7_ASPAV|nr:hypothetical protein BDV25DRAFT_137337 [Aspergillus avenaceus]
MAPYFSTVVSESAFKARFQAENAKPFSELENAAASCWGRPHLLACRVIRREPQRTLLPILSDYISPSDTQCPSNEIRAYLQGPDLALMGQSEHYLVRSSDCPFSVAQIWAAMAMFKGDQERRTRLPLVPKQQDYNDESDVETRDPKRRRRYTFQPGFVDSSGIQIGSSSPLADGSFDGSEVSSLAYVDPDSHYLSMTPEDNTLRLASCVIRHILYFAPPQDAPIQPVAVEFRDAKTRLSASTWVRERPIIAIDDGGLCLRRQNPDGGFMLSNDHVAILEGKTQFHCLEDGRPVISDDSFAQMICEALATRLSDATGHSEQSVIIINATQHYMCFLQVDISDDYLSDFESPTPTHMLYVNATPWFDLSQRSGRESVLANICGIMRRAISE